MKTFGCIDQCFSSHVFRYLRDSVWRHRHIVARPTRWLCRLMYLFLLCRLRYRKIGIPRFINIPLVFSKSMLWLKCLEKTPGSLLCGSKYPSSSVSFYRRMHKDSLRRACFAGNCLKLHWLDGFLQGSLSNILYLLVNLLYPSLFNKNIIYCKHPHIGS